MHEFDIRVTQHLANAQPDNWWLDDDPLEPNSHPALVGEVTADLCVVGGGYTGLWTALLAKERDPSRIVVLLEQDEDRKSTRLNSSHVSESRMPSSA